MPLTLTMHRTALRRGVLALVAFAWISGACPRAAQAEPLGLTLDRAIELGLKNDEGLRQAAEAVAGAQGQVAQARSNALPQLSLVGQYGRNILKPSFFLPPAFREGFDAPARIEIGEDNTFTGAATVTQVLWAAGRVSAGLNAAREYLQAFHYQETAASDYVRFAVKQAYFGALVSAEMLRIAERAFETTEEAARVAQVGFDQGTASRFDVMRAEVELENRRAPLVEARSDFDLALMTLRRRCGIEPTQEVSLVDSLTAVSRPPSLDAVLEAMRRGSAEVRALKHMVEARRQYLRIAKAGRYPMLNLSANYAVQAEWSDKFLPPNSMIGTSAAVAVALQIPIFDGLNTKGMIGTAQADLRSSELDLQRAINDKELAVRQSYAAVENALTALDGRREAVRLAEEAYRLALVRLANGLATPLERLDAELAMTTARAQLAETMYSAELSLATLELAVGTEGFTAVTTTPGQKKETGNE
jgi:outer membrane protein